MFDLPVTDPVLIFALAMVIFLIAPIIMSKLRIPGIIGLIIAGIIVGPNGLGILDRDPTIILLGTVGLLYIIFIAGLEIDLDGFKKYRNRSVIFGLLSFTIPFIFGTILGFLLEYSLPAAILLGSILGSHTLLAYPIASRLGVSKNKAVTTAVGGLILTDTLALLVLAVIAGLKQGDISILFWLNLGVSLTLYVCFVLFLVPMIGKFFFRSVTSHSSMEYLFVMSVLFVCAYIATIAGVQPIIGAFLAGLALNRLIFEQGPLMNRIKFVGNALFIPFFLLSVGMLVDFRVLIEEPLALVFAFSIVALVNMGKSLAAWIAGKIYQYSNDEIKVMYGLTIPQAAATLAATLVGYELGLFSLAIVNGVIIMILVTCLIGPYMVEKYSRKIAQYEMAQPYQQSAAPERILIPLANPKTIESLLDLAFILKTPTSAEPLYPISVVRGNGGGEEAKVAEAERMLGHAVMYASGADIPIRLLTRVDHNPSSGIIRAVTDTRISMIIVGWNGKLSTPQRILGGVIDQVLEQTNQMMLVTKLTHPLNTTKRMILILPPMVYRKPGFIQSIQTIKRMASQIGAVIVCLVIKGDQNHYKKLINDQKPDIPIHYERIYKWKDLERDYFQQLKNDDLILVISARRGTIAWHPYLEKLPREISKVSQESFIILFPEENENIDLRGTRGTSLPKTVLPDREYEN
ncbi:cation:proton antiporter [Anaerobacillus alkaliphilus]|uniref:Cation:proton antiporter n=1 Tax=Anaerobacillus alkaliphilus TaxID=1548597 RepID=A0A4Q0VQI8_9BACI|nr:cation:proton antiporter [Anaerobacillus alkaliphilus]RXI98225.1 cation:proton antiporter [Anaerobacillus alkaliphilus]